MEWYSCQMLVNKKLNVNSRLFKVEQGDVDVIWGVLIRQRRVRRF